jgi:hypothetical protein
MNSNNKHHLNKLKQLNKNVDALKFSRSEEQRAASSIVISTLLPRPNKRVGQINMPIPPTKRARSSVASPEDLTSDEQSR